jgi:FkbM family methyltransferase
MNPWSSLKEKAEIASQCRKNLTNWPEVLARVLLSYLRIRPGRFTVIARTGVTVSAPNRPRAWWPLVEILACDTYDFEGTFSIDKQAPHTVLDIGAHVGSFTCALAERLPEATFVCLEPSALTTTWLNANLKRNHLTSRVSVLALAVTEIDGPVTLWEDEEVSGQNSLLLGAKRRESVVDGIRFDSLIAQMSSSPDIVKLDCEGGEYFAILSSSAHSWSDVSQVFLEYHAVDGHSFHELENTLNDFGLKTVRHVPHPSLARTGTAYFSRD